MMGILKQMRDVLETVYPTYFPSQHKGDCIEPYIVIKQAGTVDSYSGLLNISSERPLYTIMCYVPVNEYSKLDDMVLNVKQTMKALYPLLMYAGNQTPSFYDDTINGHMVSFQYQNCRKIENF